MEDTGTGARACQEQEGQMEQCVAEKNATKIEQEVEELKEAQWGAQLEPERHSVCKQ